MGRRGILICIEGLDKSGKTTQSLLLVEALKREGFDATYTSEPSSGEIGKFIKRYVLGQKEKRIPVAAEALLFAADRAEHVEREIKPLLEEGKIVISDRYVYSSIAYQGAAGLDIGWIEEINRMALEPDLAIYIDVPVEVVIRRFKKGKDRTIMENPEVQRSVREIYLKLVKEGKLIMIDGNRSIKSVFSQIRRIVLNYLKTRRP
ncbi:dTMP kinase [Candidatus Bathyarchaeota archaeon]|nr:dTMP kinase [Candidatus Bathyarchaeota archaeon]